MMSSKLRECFKRERSVCKKFRKCKYLFNSKSGDQVTFKTKPSKSMVPGFQLLTFAIKGFTPYPSDAS